MNGLSPGAGLIDQVEREGSTQQDQWTRTEAITLIRARTLSRLSPVDFSPEDLTTHQGEQASTSDVQVAEWKQPPVVIMEPVHPSKKRINKTNKVDQKAGEKERGSSSKDNEARGRPPPTQTDKDVNNSRASRNRAKSQIEAKPVGRSQTSPSKHKRSRSDTPRSTKNPQSGERDPLQHAVNTSPKKKKQTSKQADPVSDKRNDISTLSSINSSSNTDSRLIELEAEWKPIEHRPVNGNQSKGQQIRPGSQKVTKMGELTPAQELSSTASKIKLRPPSPDKRSSDPSKVASPDQFSGPSSPTRKTTIPNRGKLSPIQEVSSKGSGNQSFPNGHSVPAQQDFTTAHSQNLHYMSSPSSTTSTIWTTKETQLTPQSCTTMGSPQRRDKCSLETFQQVVADAQTFVPSQIIDNHAHAHPSLPTTTSTQSPERPRAMTMQKPEGFFWQLDSHGFPCAKFNCDSRCNLWDGASVICPRCGPYSEVRYCGKEHLLEEIKYHWLVCGDKTFIHPCKESTIPKDVRDSPPLIPCFHDYDTPERHRQAVYFNVNAKEGDYFIFADWKDFYEAGFPKENVSVRCSSQVIQAVKFDNPMEKDRFRRVLAACLLLTIETRDLVDYMYRLIRDNLRSHDKWSDSIDASLRYQLDQELAAYTNYGERHACETDWNGLSRRNCRDGVCRAEFFHVYGALGGRGHARLLDHLEANHWILRAVRTTHPEVTEMRARMRGEGFKEVADEDKRSFCRGEGWDGVGSGDMEIEGINA